MSERRDTGPGGYPLRRERRREPHQFTASPVAYGVRPLDSAGHERRLTAGARCVDGCREWAPIGEWDTTAPGEKRCRVCGELYVGAEAERIEEARRLRVTKPDFAAAIPRPGDGDRRSRT